MDLTHMSWRRFTALLRGLGPYSASLSRAQFRRAEARSKEKVVEIKTPEDAERTFQDLFRPSGYTGKKH